MEKRELICICCPLGCMLQVEMSEGTVKDVEGNRCLRGKTYAEKEVTNPTRTVTTTVRLKNSRNGEISLPCKTAEDVPKFKIFDVIQDLAQVIVTAPVHIGDVICEDVGGTGIDMIATKNID